MFLELYFQLLMDKMYLREEILKDITDPILLMEQKKIWAIEDAGDKIASAVKNQSRGFSIF